jgi:isocitrate/isopropylmalate dehydrogenase
MLNHIADTREDERCRKAAVAIRSAYDKALQDGDKTGDLGGTLGTEEFADAIISRLRG